MMKILEFYGLPGSGKSTVCECIIEKLRNQGETVGNIDNHLECCKGVYWVLKGLASRNGFIFCVTVFKMLRKRKLLLCRDVILRILRILQFFAFYDMCEKKKRYTYVVMDQAVIQGYISTFYDYIEMAPDDCQCVQKAVSSYEFMSFYMDVCPEVASERIDIRGEEDHGRCDKIKDRDVRIQILDTQAKNFECAYSFFSRQHLSYRIDGNLDVNEKVMMILEKIAKGR